MSLLLERDEELVHLGAALSAAASGHGRAVFVAGEAGIGKSTLVDRFVSHAAESATVAIGRCDSLITPRALGPFLDIARALDVAGPSDRDGLFAALLDGVTKHAPAVIVVEDAHWADGGTIDLVALLSRRANDLPLLFVVTYRDNEIGSDHPMRPVLGNLATSAASTWLPLGPLSVDAVRTLVADAEAMPEDLHALTGGNPFYVTETLAAPPGSLSTNVRLAVLARASRLGEPGRAALDALAVVPGRAESWLLDALCRPDGGDIDECVSAGVVRREADGFEFRHELARQVIEQELSISRSRELHRRAAAALDARPGRDPARLAHHAARSDDVEALARASAEACRVAVDRGAAAEAVEHGERAIAVREHLTADEQAALDIAHGQALFLTARFDESITATARGAEHWRATADVRREAMAMNQLCGVYTAVARIPDAAAAATRAVSLLERERPGPELAGTYQRLCSLHMLARERDEAAIWGERAVALATALDDPLLLGFALVEYGIADVMDSRFDGLERIRRAIELGHERSVPTVVAQGLSQIGSGCGELRRYDLAVPALVEGMSFTGDRGLVMSRLYITAWLARCRFDLGEWEDAERLAYDVIGGSTSSAIARFVALNTLGWLRARRGDDDVWPLLDEALAIARRTGHLQRLWPCAVARAEAGSLAGDPEPHVAMLEECLELAIARRHRIATGQLMVTLRRAGNPAAAPAHLAAEPFASLLAGVPSDAAAGFDDMGCRYEAAEARADVGDAASMCLALAAFDALGAAPAISRTTAALAALGVHTVPTAVTAPPNPGGLSGREIEVLRLVAAGFTNPQIASALYISRKTAEHHVSNILTKLGVSTRTQAATESVRLGLTAL